MSKTNGSSGDSRPPATVPAGQPQPVALSDDLALVEALRRRDDAAFVELLERYHSSLLSLASRYVGSRAAAEEVVQETWLAVLQGIDGFESRSLLKTWIFSILINRAKTHGKRERRMVPFSAFVSREVEAGEFAVEPERFQGPHEEWPGHWALPPTSWGENAEQRLLTHETLEHIEQAIEVLPEAQQVVITLRDVEGWTSEEVCNVLEISETNQRVLLHRARSKVRSAVERYFAKG